MSDDEDDEADALNFASDVAPPALEADDAFDAPVTSAAAESTAAAQGKKAKKGIGGKQVVWDENLGQYVEGSYEAEEKILTDQWIQTRYAQTLMNLKKCAMEGGTFGAALITHDEVAACEKGLLAALEAVKADQLAARKEETASAVFWAIAYAPCDAVEARTDAWRTSAREGSGSRARSIGSRCMQARPERGGAPRRRLGRRLRGRGALLGHGHTSRHDEKLQGRGAQD